MRYYVKTLSGEKGPYELEQIRESLRAGRLQKDSLLRPEDSPRTVTADEVVPNEGTTSGGRDPADIFAPPGRDGDSEDAAPMNQGNFWQGFALGFICGCVGLIISMASGTMGPETKRGVQVGFAVQFMLGVLRLIVFGVPHGSGRF